MKSKRYYVKAEKDRKDVVTGYGVYDCIGGMESQHGFYKIGVNAVTAESCLYLANMHRDDLNNGIK